MKQPIAQKSLKQKSLKIDIKLALLAIIMLSPSFTLNAMAPKKLSVDQFNLVVAMGLWDQALNILGKTKSKRAKKAFLLGDNAQDDEMDTNLHQAALRAPLETLKQFVEHAKKCDLDMQNLFVYGENGDGHPLRLSILDMAYSREYAREYDRELAIAYLKKEVFTNGTNHLVKPIHGIKHGEQG